MPPSTHVSVSLTAVLIAGGLSPVSVKRSLTVLISASPRTVSPDAFVAFHSGHCPPPCVGARSGRTGGGISPTRPGVGRLPIDTIRTSSSGIPSRRATMAAARRVSMSSVRGNVTMIDRSWCGRWWTLNRIRRSTSPCCAALLRFLVITEFLSSTAASGRRQAAERNPRTAYKWDTPSRSALPHTSGSGRQEISARTPSPTPQVPRRQGQRARARGNQPGRTPTGHPRRRSSRIATPRLLTSGRDTADIPDAHTIPRNVVSRPG